MRTILITHCGHAVGPQVRPFLLRAREHGRELTATGIVFFGGIIILRPWKSYFRSSRFDCFSR